MTAPFRRRVHFISGFDPRGPVHYHRLYRDEAEKQSKLNGSHLSIGARKRMGDGVHRWMVEGTWPDGQAVTDYRFMAWDDVIRKYWTAQKLPSLLGYLRDISHYVVCGAFVKLARTGKGPFYASLTPLAIAAPPLVLAALVAIFAGPLSGLASLCLALLAIHGLMRKIDIVWLTNIYAFCCAWGRAPLPDLEARLDAMAALIAQGERDEPADEIILAGHSVGALLAMAVMARLLKGGTRIKLLTVGACVPMVGLMPGAVMFRRDLETLSGSPDLHWRDVASISDPLSFARVDPLAVCGINRRHPDRQSRKLVPFVRMFSPEKYARMKPDKLRLHFQYLMAAEIAADYDYFRLTAGPK